MFGNIIHTFCAYLHLNPFLFRSKNSDMQAFVSVALRDREPVAHTFGIALVHICDDTEDLPAILLLLFGFGIQNDTDSKEVVNAIDIHMLLFHLLPDRVDTLSTALHVEFQACGFQLLIDGADEVGYVSIAAALSLVKFLLNMVIGIMLEVFKAKVLQFALQLVKSQLVGKGSI